MPSYKLCYFNSRGLGEMSRILFAEAGVEFEDVRYTHDVWPQHKAEMMFGKMPVLFVDGEQIAHSRAAFRYLARIFKLEGGSDLIAAKIDVWVEIFIEALMKLPFTEKDEKIKEEKSKEVMKDVIIPILAQLEKTVGASEGPYVFSEFTALDVFFYTFLNGMIDHSKSDAFLEGFPKVKTLMKAVGERPKIAAWIKKRPKTDN